MNSILTRLLVDLQSDWPFFLYMAMCQWFSICFLKQRRTEAKHYKQRLDLMNYDKQRQEMLQDLGADPYVD